MPLEINCKNIGVVIHNIAKELKKTLGTFIENKCIKVFITTHKTLFIFVDDVLEKNTLLKNIAEIINKYDIQCEFRILSILNNQSLEIAPKYYSPTSARRRF